MGNLQSKVLTACAWFFGIIFIMGGLGTLLGGEGFVTGILMLIGGCLLLPPVKRLILDRKPSLSRGKITALGCVLLLISGFFIPSDDSTQQTSASDNQVQSDTTEYENTNLVSETDEQFIEDEVAVAAVDDEVISTEDEVAAVADDGYDDNQDTEIAESKRSKIPNIFIDFSVENREVDNTPVLTFVSRNKKPLHIYDVIVNDGISCNIYGDKSERNGVVNFGEKFELIVYGCSHNQIVEVKVITDKGYNVFTF